LADSFRKIADNKKPKPSDKMFDLSWFPELRFPTSLSRLSMAGVSVAKPPDMTLGNKGRAGPTSNPDLSEALKMLANLRNFKIEDITFLTLQLLIDSFKDKKAKILLKNAIKKIFENAHQNSIQTLIDDFYFYDYFESEELYSLLFSSNSPITQKILSFFKDFPQSRVLFDKTFEKFDHLDKKDESMTGTSGESAKEYIIGIISETIEPNYQSLHFEFTHPYEELKKKDNF